MAQVTIARKNVTAVNKTNKTTRKAKKAPAQKSESEALQAISHIAQALGMSNEAVLDKLSAPEQSAPTKVAKPAQAKQAAPTSLSPIVHQQDHGNVVEIPNTRLFMKKKKYLALKEYYTQPNADEIHAEVERLLDE